MKIAVVSFAHLHATEYVAALRRFGGIEIAACDAGYAGRPVAEEGGPELAAKLGIGYFETEEELWAWRPDGVVICAENVRHHELGLRAAAEGVHALCEKPLATSTAHAAEMREAARAAGTVLMTAFPVRFAPSYADLRAAVRRGDLGQIVSIAATNCGGVPTSRDWFVDPARSGGGALTDHVVHVADLLADLLEDDPVEVYAIANTIPNPGVDVETAGLVSLRYRDGVIASIDCSWSRPPGRPNSGDLVTLTVIGTEGVAEIAPFADVLTGWNHQGALAHGWGAPLDDLLIRAFLDAVRAGESRQPDAMAGHRTTALVEAAYRSLADQASSPLEIR
ncbi:Gfo/Idh/MocA family protein [Nonomuraea soli]|uniref:Putative dehydrogenase n=1 Tax=Nonomuraea soli TaxID=1032476 RepID=A0A7W0HQU4_9ACTN|nr:Gfo/Idh/MocA family oxidoreductase [Nonomuraea soli]MBA2892328.1 putative dehydrogenase [Nonomuraea soli]